MLLNDLLWTGERVFTASAIADDVHYSRTPGGVVCRLIISSSLE